MSAIPDLHDGYSPRQLADIQRETNENLAEIVDPVTEEKPFQNATDDTILQQVVAIISEQIAKVENIAKVAFNMRDPLTAIGVALSALVQLNAILRKPGSATIVPITITGSPNTIIPLGSLISTADNKYQFSIYENVVVPETGTVDLYGYCTEYGSIDPEPDSVVVISTPVSGWYSVTNKKAVSVGRAEESDAELKRRQQQSTNNTAFRHIEAIRAAVLDVPGVTFCRAYQNRTLVTDERGIPGKDVGCVVVGGDEREIANAIFYEFGIAQVGYGNRTEVFYDDQNIPYPISFSRPVEREISVRVTLSIVVDENIQIFPSNAPELIAAAIVKFANEGSSTCEPIGNPGFPPGQDIIVKWLDTPINSIGGADIVSVEVAVDGGDFATGNIAIAWDEVGIFDTERIQVKIL